MTRTARATFPRAIIKDRAESKSGMDKHIPKNGAGTHNWGSLFDERELEDAGELDEERDLAEAGRSVPEDVPATTTRRVSSVTEEERQQAKEFRKNALKTDGIDLASIARTSVAASSPKDERPIEIIGATSTAALKAL